MSLLDKPVISDSDVECVLYRAVGIINPLLDLLAQADPLGLRERTGDLSAEGVVGHTLDIAAWVLNVADVPGTTSWEGMDVDERIDWWVQRVGALNTVAVAFPGFFGVIADRLPLQDFLGFASQAIVLCAVARELGVTDRRTHVRLLGVVMCDRDFAGPPSVADDETAADAVTVEWSLPGVGKALWQLVGLMRAIGDELVKRPKPRGIYHYLGMLPAAGAVADYFGEYGALKRAAKEARTWLGTNPQVETRRQPR